MASRVCMARKARMAAWREHQLNMACSEEYNALKQAAAAKKIKKSGAATIMAWRTKKT